MNYKIYNFYLTHTSYTKIFSNKNIDSINIPMKYILSNRVIINLLGLFGTGFIFIKSSNEMNNILEKSNGKLICYNNNINLLLLIIFNKIIFIGSGLTFIYCMFNIIL